MTKAEFLSILAIQSDRLKAEYEKPGWNMWALLGALSSICWIILELHSQDRIEYYNSMLILMTVFIIEPLLTLLYNQLQPGASKITDLYVNLKVQLRASVQTFLFKVAIYSFILYLGNSFFEFNSFETTIINIYAITVIIVYIFLIVLSRFDLYIKIPNAPKRLIKWSFGAFLLLFLGICTYVLLYKIQLINVIVIQSALLFSGAYFVTKKIIEHAEVNPLLDSLDELIDEVTFDEISIEEAEQQLYMIVNGIQFSQLMSPQINEYHHADKHYHDLLKHTENAVEELRTGNKDKINEGVDNLTNRLKELNDQMELINQLKQKVDRKIALYSAQEKESEEFNSIKNRFEALDKARTEEVKRLNDLIDSLRINEG